MRPHDGSSGLREQPPTGAFPLNASRVDKPDASSDVGYAESAGEIPLNLWRSKHPRHLIARWHDGARQRMKGSVLVVSSHELNSESPHRQTALVLDDHCLHRPVAR